MRPGRSSGRAPTADAAGRRRGDMSSLCVRPAASRGTARGRARRRTGSTRTKPSAYLSIDGWTPALWPTKLHWRVVPAARS